MVTSFLQGGLCNQMFQIAATFSLSKHIGTDFCFDFEKCHTPNQGNKSTKYSNNIFKFIKNGNLNFDSFNKYVEPKFSYSKIPMIDNTIIHGYFQSEKYFYEHKEEVKNLFFFDKKTQEKVFYFLKKILETCDNTTAIHVRRGDYLKHPNFHPICTLEYYNKSMSVMNETKTNFIFISDDIEWCKKNFNGDNIFFSPFTDEIDDLYLMINCNNQIMANSSFSWWGSYLSNNKNKVISPNVWFGNNGPQDTLDLYLNNWIKI